MQKPINGVYGWKLMAASISFFEGLNICTSGSATSCEECLLIHPKCAWCSKEVRRWGRGGVLWGAGWGAQWASPRQPGWPGQKKCVQVLWAASSFLRVETKEKLHFYVLILFSGNKIFFPFCRGTSYHSCTVFCYLVKRPKLVEWVFITV